jgi:pyruvate/2-oxoglutarate dehydrogenase complex dihydrolipoamide dehydrogenase (E3) component
VRTSARASRVTRRGEGLRVDVDGDDGTHDAIECDTILVAAGRLPNIEGLGLEKAGVATTGTGVRVDAHLRTSQPHIYAAGDVIGSLLFTHVANYHARVVARNVLFPWRPVKADESIIPWCTYTSPEVARVGLSEAEARHQGIAYDLYRQPLEDLDRAIVESEEVGFAKVLVKRGGDRILGATIVSEHAGELIHEFALAMKAKVGLDVVARTIHAYPTYAEILRQLADQRQKARLTPLARRAIGWLYRVQRRG